jgi:uncharacterized protein (TIGR03067 family)
MHCDPQISLHEIAPPFNSSSGAKIHRGSTDHFIRAEISGKTLRLACIFVITLDKLGCAMQKGRMIKAVSILAIGVLALISADSATNPLAGTSSQSRAAQRDYQLLTGTWLLTRGVVNGKPVPASVARNTILITDRNTFRFPKQSGIGTHPAGYFTVNPNTRPKQVDSIAEGGPNAGRLTRGIYEIIHPTHKRACWGPPGGPRPTEFKSPPGSHRILQYWKKIGPVPSR